RSCAPRSRSHVMSAPALKAPPWPVRTTTSTDPSAAMVAKRLASSRCKTPFTAFNGVGGFNVTVRMPPSFEKPMHSKSPYSIMSCSDQTPRGLEAPSQRRQLFDELDGNAVGIGQVKAAHGRRDLDKCRCDRIGCPRPCGGKPARDVVDVQADVRATGSAVTGL